MGGWAKLSRLVIALAVAAVAAVGTASGSAHAQQVPQPGGCEGWVTVYWPVVLDGTPFELSSYGTCGLHSFTFEGRAAPGASANLCSLEQSSLSFAGTEQVDDGPVLSSTWAITGANGIFAITTTSADGTQRAGAFDATLCDSGIAASGPAVLATLTPAPPRAPEVFMCHATATVDQFTSFDNGHTVSGQAQGAGTCRSSNGTWQATLAGAWSRPLGWSVCPGSVYQFRPLVLTQGAMSSTANQNWASAPVSSAADTVASVGGLTAPPGLDAGDHHVMTVIGTGLVGAGRIEESPDPCIIQWPDPFQVTADWVVVSGI